MTGRPANPGRDRARGCGAGAGGAVARRFLTTQLLSVMAKLGVADVLADRPRAGAEVAGPSGRIRTCSHGCWGLALEEVLEELDGGRFALTEVGHAFARTWPGQGRGPVRFGGLGLLVDVGGGSSAWSPPPPRAGLSVIEAFPADRSAPPTGSH